MKYAKLLKPGDTIGIISPSHIAGENDYNKIMKTIENMGFRVKFGENIFKNTYGYLASEQERADDLNNMVANNEVKMILFGGGWGASEILPLIDYENIKRNPKIFSSYSDGTSILNAIYSKTGLITYYGLGAGEFRDLRYCDYEQFAVNFINGNKANGLNGNGSWRIIRSGVCEGILTGGYTQNFALSLSGEYFRYNNRNKYILFIEDHEKFSNVAGVSVYLSHVEQYDFIKNVSGLFFGHYSNNPPAELFQRLERFGNKYNIPVVYCDDFGHDTKHSILPVGIKAKLETDKQILSFKK